MKFKQRISYARLCIADGNDIASVMCFKQVEMLS